MPDKQSGINAILATTQSLFTVLRDVFLVILFVILLCFPAQLNSMLSKAGITQLNGGIFTWQAQAQQATTQSTAAAQSNSSASESIIFPAGWTGPTSCSNPWSTRSYGDPRSG